MKESFIYQWLLVLTMALWGMAWPIAKILVADAPPLVVGSMRFVFGSIFFLSVTILNPNLKFVRITRSNFLGFFLLGLFGIFGYGILFLVGLQFTTSALGAIIAGVNPAVITVFAFIFYKQKLKRNWQYSGLIISFIGVIFVIGISSIINYQPDYLIGNLIILCAMLCWGTYSNIGSKVMRSYSSFISTSYAVYIGAILFSLASLVEGSFLDFQAYRSPNLVPWNIIFRCSCDIYWLLFIFSWNPKSRNFASWYFYQLSPNLWKLVFMVIIKRNHLLDVYNRFNSNYNRYSNYQLPNS